MKIGIDLGHRIGKDRGAVGYIAEEKIINDVGNLVIDKLRKMGHIVVELRPDSATTVQDSLYKRYTKANDNQVQLCVSIHANAGGGRGTEVFTYNAKELKEARQVLNNIVSLGFINRGIKDGSNLAMVKRPTAPAMLIEICFVDDNDDINKYNSVGAEAIANAITQGITGEEVKENKGEWLKGKTQGNTDKWWYKHNDGSYTVNNWEQIDGEWYFFDEEGWAKTGWLEWKGDWYYMYYDTCSMAHDCELYGYKFNTDGRGIKL